MLPRCALGIDSRGPRLSIPSSCALNPSIPCRRQQSWLAKARFWPFEKILFPLAYGPAGLPVPLELSGISPVPWLNGWMWGLLHEERYERR